MEQLSMFDPVGIPLSKGYVAFVDPIDSDLLTENWQSVIDKHHDLVYAARWVASQEAKCGKQAIRMHRVIVSRILGRELQKSELVDHINGDGLDNRRGNLRLATHGQNMKNRKRRKDNKSGYKGVYRVKGWRKWRAEIRVDNNKISLGYFDTPEEAYAAYCEASLKYHGEFGRVV